MLLVFPLLVVPAVFSQTSSVLQFEPDHPCNAQPCGNACECSPAAANPADYTCRVNSGGAAFVGKNCEYALEATCNKFEIELKIPQQANIRNIGTQGGSPVSEQLSEDGELVVKTTCQKGYLKNSEFLCSDTFISRDSEQAGVNPLVNVNCAMEIFSVQNLVQSTVRHPSSTDIFSQWDPIMNFYTTSFGSEAPVLCPAVADGAGYTYVVGSKIHVVITGLLNGEIPSNEHHVHIHHCNIWNPVDDSKVRLIAYGQTDKLRTSVGIEQNPGFIGEGLDATSSGAAFWFQVFKFKNSNRLNLECSIGFISTAERRRRSPLPSEEISIPFIVLEEDPSDEHDVLFQSFHTPTITINEAITNHIVHTECEGILCAAEFSRHYAYAGYSLLVLVMLTLASLMFCLNRGMIRAYCLGKEQLA